MPVLFSFSCSTCLWFNHSFCSTFFSQREAGAILVCEDLHTWLCQMIDQQESRTLFWRAHLHTDCTRHIAQSKHNFAVRFHIELCSNLSILVNQFESPHTQNLRDCLSCNRSASRKDNDQKYEIDNRQNDGESVRFHVVSSLVYSANHCFKQQYTIHLFYVPCCD